MSGWRAMSTSETQRLAEATTSKDLFLGGALKIRQPRNGYRAGTDAVLLAALISSDPAGPVLDAGAGVGVVGLCVAARFPKASVVLVEREPHLVSLARRNVDDNGLSARVRVIEADIMRATDALRRAGIKSETFALAARQPPLSRRPAQHGGRKPVEGRLEPDAGRRIRCLGALHVPHGGAGRSCGDDPQDRGAATHPCSVRWPLWSYQRLADSCPLRRAGNPCNR